MKLTSFYAFALFSFFALLLTSCDNEPLEGEFVSDIPDIMEASFTAEVEGVEFVADTMYAVTQNSVTSITGVKSNGDRIVMTVQGVGPGSYNLTGNEGVATFGINVAPEAFSTDNPGGSGQLVITNYDTENNVMSGTFSFVALRPLLDNNGLPLLDENGNPTFDSVTISNGEFTDIALVTDGSTNIPPLEDFLIAKIDGVDFEANDLTISTAGIVAVQGSNTVTNQSIIIYFPEGTEAGTYDLTFTGDYSAGYFNSEITFTSQTGVLTILENSATLLRFTFSFEASELEDGEVMHTITEGEFQFVL